MRSFGARVRAGEQVLGALVRMPNEGLVELAAMVGLDFVVVDTEHGPGDQLSLAHHLNAAAANDLAVIVRIGSPAEVLRALDLGAAGVLAPHVASVAQARELIDAVHYPPLGRRGFAGYTRAGRYGLTPALEHYANGRQTLLIAMIEDPAGLAAASEIAALEGVDGLMLGPADFAVELGVLGSDDVRVTEAATSVRRSARSVGAAAVAIVSSAPAASQAFAAGSTVVMYNLQHALGQLFTTLAAGRPGAADGLVTTSNAHGASTSRAATSSGRQPLVLLPGMLGTADVWDEVAAELLDVAAVQFARIDLDDSISEMAQSVLAAAPARFALAGHSLGGIVALEIMRQAPERVTRLALVNASGRGPTDGQRAVWGAWSQRVEDGTFADAAAELSRTTLPAGAADELIVRNEKMALDVGAAGFRRQLAAQAGRRDYRSELAGYRVPVLIVGGALDTDCPPQRQLEMAEHCPQAELITIDDAGHMAPMERPSELAAQLRAWLGRV